MRSVTHPGPCVLKNNSRELEYSMVRELQSSSCLDIANTLARRSEWEASMSRITTGWLLFDNSCFQVQAMPTYSSYLTFSRMLAYDLAIVSLSRAAVQCHMIVSRG
jgi:hypothetical protein